jgi:tetratricopeptide (TPR) repeat protein
VKFVPRTIILASVMTCSASIAQQEPQPPPAGTHEVRLSRSEIDKTLSEFEPHAREFPVRFASAQQRSDMQDKLVQLLVLLDAGVKQYPNDPDFLLRDAVANGFGHNMGCPECGEKAIAAYERLIQLRPDSAEVNWRYGGFLAQTVQRERAIPYLQKAAGLGVSDAHYTAAMVFLGLNDQENAKLELRQYVRANPKDKAAKELLDDIEHGNVHVHTHDGPPPQGLAVRP